MPSSTVSRESAAEDSFWKFVFGASLQQASDAELLGNDFERTFSKNRFL